MSTNFTGEILMFGGTYAMHNFAFTSGSILAISTYSQLYSLIGTLYGGNGVNSFALPDLRGRVPVHQGTGPGLTYRGMGNMYGIESVTLTTSQIPIHTHNLQASTSNANTSNPQGAVLANASATSGANLYTSDTSQTSRDLNINCVRTAGNSMSHPNRMPTQAINFVMCLNGIYPSRN